MKSIINRILSCTDQCSVSWLCDRRGNDSVASAQLGPSVLAALDDPDVIEIILNPDGTLWLESHGGGMRPAGTEMHAVQAERLIGTVRSPSTPSRTINVQSSNANYHWTEAASPAGCRPSSAPRRL